MWVTTNAAAKTAAPTHRVTPLRKAVADPAGERRDDRSDEISQVHERDEVG
jgi:hypothetical protein